MAASYYVEFDEDTGEIKQRVVFSDPAQAASWPRILVEVTKAEYESSPEVWGKIDVGGSLVPQEGKERPEGL